MISDSIVAILKFRFSCSELYIFCDLLFFKPLYTPCIFTRLSLESLFFFFFSFFDAVLFLNHSAIFVRFCASYELSQSPCEIRKDMEESSINILKLGEAIILP